MMYYRDPDGRVVGVLNDWDLATVVCDSTTPSTDRTGTIPFMALRLLTGHDVEHKYRHEAESFIWACAWVCACADGKKEMLVKPYATWRTLDMAQCAISRGDFLGGNLFERVNVHEHHQSNALLSIFLLSWLHEIHLRRWSEPANAETEREDIKVFRKLINELDAIGGILEVASQTPELRIFDYIRDFARKFIVENYPSNGTPHFTSDPSSPVAQNLERSLHQLFPPVSGPSRGFNEDEFETWSDEKFKAAARAYEARQAKRKVQGTTSKPLLEE
jgi:Fungal protein kinase